MLSNEYYSLTTWKHEKGRLEKINETQWMFEDVPPNIHVGLKVWRIVRGYAARLGNILSKVSQSSAK